jgi:hypothetical protein
MRNMVQSKHARSCEQVESVEAIKNRSCFIPANACEANR